MVHFEEALTLADQSPWFALLSLLALSMVAVAAHELGHVVAAVACGVRPIRYQIGLGPVLCVGRVLGCRVFVGLYPIGGLVAYEDVKRSPLVRAACAAGGPLATFCLGLLSLAAQQFLPSSLALWAFTVLCFYDSIFAISPLWSDGRKVVVNLAIFARAAWRARN